MPRQNPYGVREALRSRLDDRGGLSPTLIYPQFGPLNREGQTTIRGKDGTKTINLIGKTVEENPQTVLLAERENSPLRKLST